MVELMAPNQVAMKCGEFRQKYPWINFLGDIEGAPGWLDIIDEFLVDLSVVMGSDDYRFVKFLGIDIDRFGLEFLSVYAEFNRQVVGERLQLCRDLGLRLKQRALSICHKCGCPAFKGNYEFTRQFPVCELHRDNPDAAGEERQGKSTPNDVVSKAGKMNEYSHFGSGDESEEVEDGTVSESDPDDHPEDVVRVCKLYDLNELSSHEHDKSNDHNVNRKRKEISKKMKERGEVRAFSRVPDAAELAAELKSRFPNFTEVIDFIEGYVFLAKINGKLRIPPMLMEGPPGVGKTAFSSALAKLLGTDYVEVHMENEQSNATLAGSSEFWANSQCGVIFDTLVFGNTCNPLVVVDEVDKAAGSAQYNPLSPLYQLLERDTASQFRDLGFRSVALDASNVMWIMTANDASNLDAPILSRLRHFTIQAPTPDQSVRIAQNIYSKVLERNEWSGLFDGELSPSVASKLAEYPPRQMQSEIESALGKCAKSGRTYLDEFDIGGGAAAARRGIGFILTDSHSP